MQSHHIGGVRGVLKRELLSEGAFAEGKRHASKPEARFPPSFSSGLGESLLKHKLANS